MDGIIQKATELGVAHNSARIYKPIHRQSSSRNEKLRKQANIGKPLWLVRVNSLVVACCQRLEHAGAIADATSTNSTATLNADEQRWILSPIAQVPKMTTTLMTTTQLSSASILVGPESGFEQDELDASVSAGFSERQLGPRVLRTETAGPAAIAVLQALYGDLN